MDIESGVPLHEMRKQRSKKIDMFPFDALQIWQRFVLPASRRAEFSNVRKLASQYGQRTGKKIRCVLTQNDDLYVYRDVPDTQLARDITNDVAADKTPSKFNWNSWINSLAIDDPQTLPSTLADRFEQLIYWTCEHCKQNDREIYCIVNDDNTMTVTRKA